MTRLLYIIAVLALPGCLGEAEDRAASDLGVGIGETDGVRFAAIDGLAHVRSIGPGEVELWASAPVFDLAVSAAAGARAEWTLTIRNCMPGAVLEALSGQVLDVMPIDPVDPGDPMQARPTLSRFSLRLVPGTDALVRIAPPDAGLPGRWRFAAMGDIQRALPEVDDVFARISAEPELRFVLSTGDLVDRGRTHEYDLLQEKYGILDIPYYSTIGNHELFDDSEHWRERFGRFNIHFHFKGVVFSVVDSGSGTLDPLVYEWLDGWLDAARARVHIFATHYPPIDPIGVRSGSFNSRKEGNKLLSRLAAGSVDLTIYGHIHSFYAFENAGMPAYISGGGGALPERWDGIGRHFLAIDVSADAVHEVAVVRVD